MKYIPFKKLMMPLLFVAMVSQCDGDSSPWIWNIEGDKVTMNEFDANYEDFLYLSAHQLQVSTEELKRYIKNPREANPQAQRFLAGLQKEIYAEQYKQMLLFNLQARNDGFTEEKAIKNLVTFLRSYYLVDIFVRSKIKRDDFTVTQEEKVQFWEQIKATNPQYKQIPIDDGLKMAEQQLLIQKFSMAQQDLLESVKGGYIVESNPDYPSAVYATEDENAEGHNARWVWKIDGEEITAGAIDEGYHSFLYMTSQQLQISAEKLEEYIANPSLAPEEIRMHLTKLEKPAFLEQYKQLLLITREAEKQDLDSDKETERRINFILSFYTAHLYVMKRISPDTVEIDQEAVKEQWQKLQEQVPSYRNVPRSEGLRILEIQYRNEVLKQRRTQVLQEILEQYKIEANPDFNLREYLSKERQQSSPDSTGTNNPE